MKQMNPDSNRCFKNNALYEEFEKELESGGHDPPWDFNDFSESILDERLRRHRNINT